ncbi:MAG: hypothetical protein GW893_03670 [Armatimonadetes bacterium]|nr:hypothetical protein [Armatimonadota bacterium]
MGNVCCECFGIFCAGVFMAVATERFVARPHLRTLVAVGFLGAYTAFSTFEFESLKRTEAGSWGLASANMILSIAAGLLVVVGESDQWHGSPLFNAIVLRCRKKGIAGTTVLRGIEGYGANSRIHTAHILRLSEDLPVVVEIIDLPEKIQKLLPILHSMVTEGLTTLEDVHVVKYVHLP